MTIRQMMGSVIVEKGSKRMENNSNTGGIGFVGLLQLIFITLKLLGKISWKWVWVLSPMWISFIIVVILLLILLVQIVRGVNSTNI